MTKNKEKLVKVEAVCTSMTGEFRDTNEDNFYFNGQYMDSDGGIALRLTSGEPEEVEPEEEELSEEMLQIIEESYREAEENGEIPDFDDFDVAELLEDNPIGEIFMRQRLMCQVNGLLCSTESAACRAARWLRILRQ